MVAFVSRDTAIERRNLFVMISSSLSALFDFQIIKKIDAFRFHLAVTKELISELRNCNPFCVPNVRRSQQMRSIYNAFTYIKKKKKENVPFLFNYMFNKSFGNCRKSVSRLKSLIAI